MDGSFSPNSLPPFLAAQGIDTWGIDYGWSLVPESETNFAFMENWGIQRDIDDLEQALSFARTTRAQTGSDAGRLVLLGFSLSASTAYALLNEETHLSCNERQVRGYIPVDGIFTTNDPSTESGACGSEKIYKINGPQKKVYADNSGVFTEQLAKSAIANPGGASSVFPDLNNLQVVLVEGATQWLLVPQIPPFGHYVAGVFGAGGITTTPIGFHYTDVTLYEDVLAELPPYMPVQVDIDLYATVCGNAPHAFTDNLSEIKVPVFYIGAAGGEGNLGLFTLSQLGSSDIQSDIVSFYPPAQYALDYGHNDLFYAANASSVLWPKMASWLLSHKTDVCE